MLNTENINGTGGFDLKQLILPLVILIVVAGTVIGIVNYQKNKAAQEAPKLEIIKPSEGQELAEAQYILEGKTDSGSKVSVNDNEARVDGKGNFASEVALNEGANVIRIVATKPSGKSTKIERKVTRVTPQPVQIEPISASGATSPNNQSTDLNSSGPENFWLPEISMIAMAGTVYIASRKKLKKTYHQ